MNGDPWAGYDCRCFLPVDPPDGVKWWRPDLGDDPGPRVCMVARFQEDPNHRRAVRVEGGWAEEGPIVNFYQDRTPPMSWSRVGVCWDDTPHPVVEARQNPDGTWTTDV